MSVSFQKEIDLVSSSSNYTSVKDSNVDTTTESKLIATDGHGLQQTLRRLFYFSGVPTFFVVIFWILPVIALCVIVAILWKVLCRKRQKRLGDF